MSRIITLLLIMLLTLSCYAQNDPSNTVENIGLTPHKLNGQVLKIEDEWHEVQFDSLGNKVLEINKRAQSQDAYYYNATNQLTAIVHTDTRYPGSNNRLIYSYTDTSEICIVHNSAGEKTDSAIYFKNAAGQIIRQETYRLQSMHRQTLYFEYDTLSRVIQMEWFGIKNQLLNKWSITYDDVNESIVWIKMNGRGSIVESHKFKLDAYGNRIYDLDEDGKLTEWEYEYDSLNNWTKCTQTISGEIHSTLERKITYRN